MSSAHSSKRRLAEKLLILEDRGIGMLMRMYNVSKTFSDVQKKPKVMMEAKYESSIKAIVKKFPGNVQTLNAVSSDRKSIIQSLSLYYAVFVDVMDFRDHVYELLTNMDMWQVHLDIKLNFELTTSYLNLIVTLTSLLIMMSQVKDRKAILGLYNAAYTMEYNEAEPNFPRLGNMIMEYDRPLKTLSTDFVPHSQLLLSAIKSVVALYNSRNIPADQWRAQLKLSIISNPKEMVKPVQTPLMSCEYLSLQAIEQWIIFSLVLCHPILQEDDELKQTWLSALRSSWILPLFRDEVIHIHSYLKAFFTLTKGCTHYVNEVKHCYNQALLEADQVHSKRREFLKSAVQEVAHILKDQPGLLGPKALTVFTVLSYARDEVMWFLRHNTFLNQQRNKSKSEDIQGDLHLPELLFYMEEIRELIRRYTQIFQRYYIQYLSDYDAPFLKELIETLSFSPSDEKSMLNSLFNSISFLHKSQTEVDFDVLRLDWFRLQCLMSFAGASFHITKHVELTLCLDLIQFHAKMVDYLDVMVTITSDLSIFCFYPEEFEGQFKSCLSIPARSRYVIVFPLICAHFQSCVHELCPEEHLHLRDRSLSFADSFLQQLTIATKNMIINICQEQCKLDNKLLPKSSASVFAYNIKRNRTSKNQDEAYRLSYPQAMDGKERSKLKYEKPGRESYRKFREKLTDMDKFHMTLTELCTSINYYPVLKVWGYMFAPKSYLYSQLEEDFTYVLVDLADYSEETKHISRPSELLANVQTFMDTFKTVENYIDIDITRLFKKCLLQQTVTCNPMPTLTKLYTYWYSEVFLYQVSADNMCFAKNFMTYLTLDSKSTDLGLFNPEEYSVVKELRSLAQLIGAYGVLEIKENLMRNVACHIKELLKLTLANKDVLGVLRFSTQKPEAMKDLVKKLKYAGDLLERMKIIGILFSFKELLESALTDVLQESMPFMLNVVIDLQHSLQSEPEPSKLMDDMTSAMGLPCHTEPTLLKAFQEQNVECNYSSIVLLMVFVAVSISELAEEDFSFYKASIGSHEDNVHCVAIAVNQILDALFRFCNSEDVEKDMNEFLKILSQCLLSLGQEKSHRKGLKNRESVFLFLDEIVRESQFFQADLFENLFPYALIRQAYTTVSKQEVNN